MLHIVRIVVLSLTLLFAIVTLGLAAHFTATTDTYFGLTFNFAALAIASAVLTLVTLPVMLIVDLMRTGAFTSMVVTELVWLFVLWALWLSTGADTAWFNSLTFANSCSGYNSVSTTACNEVQAIEAFGFLNWIMLMGYSITILVAAIMASSRGHPNPWTSSVRHGNLFAPAAAGPGGAAPSMAGSGQPNYNNGAPPPNMQQHQYPPPGTPSQGYAPSGTPSQGHPSQGYTSTPSPVHQYQGSQVPQGPQGHAYV